MPSGQASRRTAVITFDVIAGLGLIALVLVGLTAIASSLARTQSANAFERQLRLVAAHALNCARVGIDDPRAALRELDASFVESIEVAFEREPGHGAWAEAERVTVVVTGLRGSGPPRSFRLSTYVFPPAEGGS